ncbi:MAG: hypothetical protein K2Y14_00225 [Burkholderiales bacterium]|nr:hypothetical protein [Burkholderiales bacterium]
MLKQVVLIDLTGQQQVLLSTKFRITYANGGQISLELARQWYEAGINLSCEYHAQAQLTTESEISSHLLLRPNGADEIYLKGSWVAVESGFLFTALENSGGIVKVTAQQEDESWQEIGLGQLVIIYENGIFLNLSLVDFPAIARGELLIKAGSLSGDNVAVRPMVNLICEPRAADLCVLKAQLWTPKFACHTGNCATI